MADLTIKNDSLATISVKINDEATPHDVAPGKSRVTVGNATFSVAKSKNEVFNGIFAGVANLQIISEQTSARTQFTVENKSGHEVVVTLGTHDERIINGNSKDFTEPGNYQISFPEPSSRANELETLKAIATLSFPEDVDNVTMRVVS